MSPSSSSDRSRSSNARASRAAARQIRTRDGVSESTAGLSEQLVDRILKPLGLVVLSRDRIAETVDEAVAEGRLTRGDAELLVMELVRRGRQQTDDLLGDLERTLGRGREQFDVATRRARKVAPDRLIRHADRARRTIGVGPAFPILGYDELTVAQVQRRLSHLSDPELRSVRDHERRNAKRKSLLRAIEKALG
jgi:polyhydroxyalkanoate synthesis regulator phasin